MYKRVSKIYFAYKGQTDMQILSYVFSICYYGSWKVRADKGIVYGGVESSALQSYE